MAHQSHRRDFLKGLLRSGAELAQEASSAIGRTDLGRTAEPEPETDPRPVCAEPTRRRASVPDLVLLCREVGFSEAREADMRRLARPSVRLTRGDTESLEPGTSRLGGVPDLPAGFRWPSRGGRDLAFLGQVNLAAVVALVPEAELPASGLLLFFYDLEERPRGLEPADRGSCRVIPVQGRVEPDSQGRAHFADHPLVLSAELTLPPADSFHVERLGLSDDELVSWDRLRERLADFQAVALEGHSPTWSPLHRLLGHPEPIHRNEMELECELVTHGLNLCEGEGNFDPRRMELERGADAWRLLLQLSADDSLSPNWGQSLERLYVWIRALDLESARFERVWAILQ